MGLQVLYEDSDLLAAVKPEGADSEAAGGLQPDMVNLVRSHLAAGQGQKRSAPYVGLIQRLDKPVRGIMLFAKNREMAAALSKALREGRIRKTYRAIICGVPKEPEGEFSDWLVQEKKGNLTRTCGKDEAGAKEARLRYRLIRTETVEGAVLSEVEIHLLTGRHHQIRVQFASRGLPLLGDRKYNPAYSKTPPSSAVLKTEMGKHLCLTASVLELTHPKTGKKLVFRIDPLFTLD